ncbi:AER452Cp [Eremothecium gossypii ATCC 10895]|uniref:triacylglycerol lipase n=1 Tax=Eremothecium gossypii (strain ATCC 10895 / CBS 109.51 / FGSC 9923 / NRRL Y-1056) TaxID=284811 RepID=Q755R6_EREGS|nr:AER452Cp [Eremothecium gossypii ATCC 10895]AAS53131.1 AER452Cp [Eremothecium gossypii ATCC 10895]
MWFSVWALVVFFTTPIYCYSDEMFRTLEYDSYLSNTIYCVEKLFLSDPFHNGQYYMEKQGLDLVKVFHTDILRGQISCTSMIAVNHTAKQISIIYRGSVTVFDWIVDFSFPPVPYEPASGAGKCPGNCLVHIAVYDQFKLTFHEVYSEFKSVYDAHPDYEVIVTGLSLGGGYAYLMGIEMQLMGYKPRVTTFGGMRVGNKEMNKWVDELFQSEEIAKRVNNNETPHNAFYRVVQAFDIVPLVPPGPIFNQAGVQFTIRDDGTFHPAKEAVTFEGAKPHLKEIISDILLNGRFLDLLRVPVHVNYLRRMGPPCLPDSQSLDGR